MWILIIIFFFCVSEEDATKQAKQFNLPHFFHRLASSSFLGSWVSPRRVVTTYL